MCAGVCVTYRVEEGCVGSDRAACQVFVARHLYIWALWPTICLSPD